MAQYEILRSLDRGGMAEVFLARLVGVEGFEKRVVLKRVLPHLSGDARLLQRFVDEARVAARLSHPNIVQIFELGEQHGQYFIAMEHVDGRNVKDAAKRLLARGERLPVAHALRIGVAVSDALHYAHTRSDDEGKRIGLVHRDVSPANVLVSYEGIVKLIDFGIARTLDGVERTSPGTVVGKAGYMSPEQMRGEPVDARTDVFACAATLFHVVTGMLPYPGVGVQAVMSAVNHGERRPFAEVRELIDEELFDVLSRGFAHEPRDRFQTALELQGALERYAGSRGLLSGTVALGEFMRATFAGDDGEAAAAQDPETQSRVVTLASSAISAVPTEDELAVVSPSSSTAPAVVARRGAGIALLAAVLLMVGLGGGGAWWLVGPSGAVTATAAVSEAVAATDAATDVATDAATDSATATEVASATEAATTATADVTTPEADAGAGTPATATATAKEVAAATTAEPVRKQRARAGRASKARVTSRRSQRAVAAEPASLTLDSQPWSEVRVNGWKVGLTPLHSIELPAGKHSLVLVNPEQGLEKRLSVTLKPGESRRLKVNLR